MREWFNDSETNLVKKKKKNWGKVKMKKTRVP